MRRLRDYLVCIFFALLLIYSQKLFFKGFPSFHPEFSWGSYLFLSLLLGFLFGLIGCPVCGMPLSISLASTENTLRSVFFKNVVFHLGRFLLIFTSAYIGGVLLLNINKVFYNLGFLLGGLFMVFIGLGIILRIKFGFSFLFTPRGGAHPLFYFLFGLSLGFACGFEAWGFLIPLWFKARNSLEIFLGGFLFSLSAILPTLAMSVLVYLGFKGLTFLFKGRLRFFLVNTSGFFLLLFGTLFVASFFRR